MFEGKNERRVNKAWLYLCPNPPSIPYQPSSCPIKSTHTFFVFVKAVVCLAGGKTWLDYGLGTARLMTPALYSINSALDRVSFCQDRCTLHSALNVSHNALCCSLTKQSVVACEKLDMMLKFSFSVHEAVHSSQFPLSWIQNECEVSDTASLLLSSVNGHKTLIIFKWMSELHTLAPLTVTYLAYFGQMYCSLSFRLS